VKRLIAIATITPVLLMVGASEASARTVWLGGHVLGPPASAGPSVSVPVLLTRAAERRLRARRSCGCWSDVGDLDGDVSSLQGQVGSLAAGVSNLQSEVALICGSLPVC
jgi:hypothetical protein